MDYDIKTILNQSISYPQYYAEVERMVNDEKTSGSVQSEALIKYTKLNYKRMKRLNKTIQINLELSRLIAELELKMHWLVITEAWCGDAAQNIPYISRLAESVSNVKLSLVYRDQNPEIMSDYLTNGARSIPKLIVLDSDLHAIATWGPRPHDVQQMVIDYKNKLDPKPNFDEFAASVHKWYSDNKNKMLETELFAIFDKVNNKTFVS